MRSLQIGHCKLVIENSPEIAVASAMRSMSNFQFAIFNLQFVFLLLLLLASPAAAQVQLPELSAAEPIAITAQAGNQWQAGSYEVWVLRGNCVIQQGQATPAAARPSCGSTGPSPPERQPHKVIAYLEGDVEVMLDRRPGAPRLTDQTWLGRFFSSAGVQVRAAATAGKPDVLPPIYWRGMERRTPESAEERLAVSRCSRRSTFADRRLRRPATLPTLRRRAGFPATPAVAPAGRDGRAGGDGRRWAADPRLSPQRRARPGELVPRSGQQPVDRRDRFRRERDRRRNDVPGSARSARSTSRPIAW